MLIEPIWVEVYSNEPSDVEGENDDLGSALAVTIETRSHPFQKFVRFDASDGEWGTIVNLTAEQWRQLKSEIDKELGEQA